MYQTNKKNHYEKTNLIAIVCFDKCAGCSTESPRLYLCRPVECRRLRVCVEPARLYEGGRGSLRPLPPPALCQHLRHTVGQDVRHAHFRTRYALRFLRRDELLDRPGCNRRGLRREGHYVASGRERPQRRCRLLRELQNDDCLHAPGHLREADKMLPFIFGTICHSSTQYNAAVERAQLQVAQDVEGVYYTST